MRGLVLLILSAAMLTSLAVAERNLAKARSSLLAVDRVDMGVELRVVRKDPTGKRLIAKCPPMAMVRTHRFGGMAEIEGGTARLVGPSRNPKIWHCSEAQERLIIHADADPLWVLIEGSEGSGKTVTIAMWLALRAIEHLGERCEIGLTAPTFTRLAHVKKAIEGWSGSPEVWRPEWYRWSERDQAYRFHVGPVVQLVSAVRRSEAGGSPVQGANWVAHAGDELQDHFEREADIEARGRSATDGRYKRMNSSTPKDSSEWRTFRALCKQSEDWSVVRMLGLESPFVSDEHWLRLRRAGTMTEREYRRRVLAMDVGPERQVYFNFRRTFDNGAPANLRTIPLGAIDVTNEILRPWGNIGVLVGHDPGSRQHVSMVLKAYRFRDQADRLPRWFVVDEITTPESTVEQHARIVLARLRSEWGCNLVDRRGKPDPDSPQVLVRIDPHTRSGDEHPGSDVYTIWRSLGMQAKAAAYRPNSTAPMVIKKSSRINMMNTLLSATAAIGEVRRLFVAIGEDGRPVAPRLVEALESMERNEAGEAEAERKDANDLSHWPAAVGYALWQAEPRVSRIEDEVAA